MERRTLASFLLHHHGAIKDKKRIIDAWKNNTGIEVKRSTHRKVISSRKLNQPWYGWCKHELIVLLHYNYPTGEEIIYFKQNSNFWGAGKRMNSCRLSVEIQAAG